MTARGQTPSALLFGEALVGYGSVEPTLCTAPQFTRFPGGADLNVAVGLARLGVRATWASVLGDDAHGDYLADALAQLGIPALARRAAGPTALMFTADLQQRLDQAAAVGALVTTRRGDLIAMPSRVEVEEPPRPSGDSINPARLTRSTGLGDHHGSTPTAAGASARRARHG